jgi:FtsP/CotA-like multicopper oxidase with cupredoxin domain
MDMMRRKKYPVFILPLLFVLLGVLSAGADVVVQCPGDTNGDAQWTGGEVQPPNVACKHVVGSDGFATMADGTVLYTFGFSDVTGVLPANALATAELNAQNPAPLIKAREGDDFYLTLTTAPMKMRPDLFDPHSVHWHGFPNAAPIFDGEPMASIAINPGASLTYYYKVPSPGTYMYHCHVEATEHMQMGMLGNLYVTPLQDLLPNGTVLGLHTHQQDPDGNGPLPGDRYAFNDGDGTTRYDLDYPVQIISFDPDFHNANENVQPLPFAAMTDRYPMINGRGYPDTINPSNQLGPVPGTLPQKYAQPTHSIITAAQGQKVLLRTSSLATVRFYTLISPSIPMRVVGKDAKLLRGTTGQNLYFTTSAITLGGGQSAEILLDTTGIAPGTYFLYTSNLNELSNDQQDFGGMMTEIVITP